LTVEGAKVLLEKLTDAKGSSVAGSGDPLGTVARGKLADLVVFPANPLVDLPVPRRATLVVKDGVVYDPAAIYRALAVAPAD
jgi:imidazolonepropionase-like amidohydrolase